MRPVSRAASRSQGRDEIPADEMLSSEGLSWRDTIFMYTESALGFVDSWKDLLGAIETKREELR
jgi:hypothetical protein